MAKRYTLLGASGSIGTQTIDIIDQHRDLYEICAISVGRRIQVLDDYIATHPSVKYACVARAEDAEKLAGKYPQVQFYYGDQGLIELTSLEEVDVVFNAIQGFPGLLPTLNAIEHHKDVAVANKETLVAAGDIVMAKAKEYGVTIIPVDSEHSAIWQTIQGYRHEDIKRLIITASGGAFKNLTRDQLKYATKADALKHPRWNMGAKITIDSASMMNKGFEVIEAHMLFDLPYEKIDTIIHPESIVHSMTEFVDHSVIAQLGVADMRMPIQFALTYPNRLENTSQTLDLAQLGALHFQEMDFERFPLVKLAYECGKKGGNLPAILNGANEQVVDLFLEDKCSFIDIETINHKVIELAQSRYVSKPTIEQIVDDNNWAMATVRELLKVE